MIDAIPLAIAIVGSALLAVLSYMISDSYFMLKDLTKKSKPEVK
jgi:hypothetical protein